MNSEVLQQKRRLGNLACMEGMEQKRYLIKTNNVIAKCWRLRGGIELAKPLDDRYSSIQDLTSILNDCRTFFTA